MFRRRHNMSFAQRPLLALIAMVGLLPDLIAGLSARPLGQQPDAVTRSKEATLKRELFEMREAIDQYYADNGHYPKSLGTLETEGYVAKIPTDPITNRSDSWHTIPARTTARGRRQPPGIYDVKSGSTGTATNGSRYSDW